MLEQKTRPSDISLWEHPSTQAGWKATGFLLFYSSWPPAAHVSKIFPSGHHLFPTKHRRLLLDLRNHSSIHYCMWQDPSRKGEVYTVSQGKDEEWEGRTITSGQLHLRVISTSFLQGQTQEGKKLYPLVNKCSTQLENFKVQAFIKIQRNISVSSAFLCSACRESTARNAWGWSELVSCP